LRGERKKKKGKKGGWLLPLFSYIGNWDEISNNGRVGKYIYLIRKKRGETKTLKKAWERRKKVPTPSLP